MFKKPFFLTGSVIAVFSAIFLAGFGVLAWTEPTSPPPEGNVAEPINAGSEDQNKNGRLGVSELCLPDTSGECRSAWTSEGVAGDEGYIAKFTSINAIGNSVIFESAGNVGIGTAAPDVKLAVGDGTAEGNIIGINGATSDYIGARISVGGAEKWFSGRDDSGRFVIRQDGGYDVLRVYPVNFSVSLGSDALKLNTGAANSAVGREALYNNTVGGYNSALGGLAGKKITVGSYNTFLGFGAGGGVNQKADALGSMALGASSYTTKNQQVVIGDTTITETLLRGNVGVGVVDPAYRLDVGGALRLGGLTSDPTPANGVMYFNSLDNKFRCYEDEWVDCVGSGAGGGDSYWDSNASNNIYNINSGGRVGIGTAAPDVKLLIGNGTTAGGNIIGINGPAADWLGARISVAGTEKWFSGRDDSGNFVIRRDSLTNDLAVTASGNVGIGTTDPSLGAGGQLKLDVEGNVGAMKYCDNFGNDCKTITELSSSSGLPPGTDGDTLMYDGAAWRATNNLYNSGDTISIGNPNSERFVLSVGSDNSINLNSIAVYNLNPYYGAEFVASNDLVGNSNFVRMGVTGSAAAASGAFKADAGYIDANTGVSGGLSIVSRHANGEIRFYTGGNADANQRMKITSSGLVGIGTNDPQEELHIKTGLSGAGIALQGGPVNVFWRIYQAIGTGGLYFQNDNIPGDHNALMISYTGNVGIGTVSQDVKLVVGNGTTAGGNIIGINGASADWLGARISVAGTEKWFSGRDDSGNFVIRRDSLTNDLAVTASGNVGIGTTMPLGKLEISGDASAGAGKSALVLSETSSNANSRNWVMGNATGPNYGNLSFYVSAVKGGTPLSATHVLELTKDGNVGIGTTDPSLGAGGQLKLDVEGNVGAMKYCDNFGNDCKTITELSSGAGLWKVNGVNIYNSNESGNVGIGISGPSQKLEVDNGNILVQGSGSFDANGEEGIVNLGDINNFIKGIYGTGVKIGVYQVPDAVTILNTSGKVGIGTTVPADKLDVNGNIRISGGDLLANAIYGRNGGAENIWLGNGDDTVVVQNQLRIAGTAADPAATGKVLTALDGLGNAAWQTFTDNNTTYSAGTGLALSGTIFSAQNTVAIWNADKLQGRTLNNTAPASGQVLKWDGSAWAPAADTDTDTNTTYSAGTGLALSGTIFSAQNTAAIWNANKLANSSVSFAAPASGQVLEWNGSAWAPGTDDAGSGGITGISVNGSGNYTNIATGAGLTASGNTISAVESDPQVGTVTSGNWCVGNGSQVTCTQSAPLTSESDPQVGANATNYIPKWNGSALVQGLIVDNGLNISIISDVITGGNVIISGNVLAQNNTHDICSWINIPTFGGSAECANGDYMAGFNKPAFGEWQIKCCGL